MDQKSIKSGISVKINDKVNELDYTRLLIDPEHLEARQPGIIGQVLFASSRSY